MNDSTTVTVHCLDCESQFPVENREEGILKPGQLVPACPRCGQKGDFFFVTCCEDEHVWISRKRPPELDWFTPVLAAEEWGLKENTIHQHLKRGKFDTLLKKGFVRRSGSTWLIHRDALWELYGPPGTKK